MKDYNLERYSDKVWQGGRKFGRAQAINDVLEIIDKESRYISSKEAYRNASCQDYWRSITSIRRAIEELRGNNKQ